jgi:putative ABC transport system substrate-binding protein
MRQPDTRSSGLSHLVDLSGGSPVLGVLSEPADVSIGGNPGYAAFFKQMKHLGYVEGDNLIVERYCLEERYDRIPEIVHEVVATRPDVIFIVTNY